jgi:hypothetical protein
MSSRHAERLLIVTDQAANPIAQVLDGLQQACRQGLVIRREQGDLV